MRDLTQLQISDRLRLCRVKKLVPIAPLPRRSRARAYDTSPVSSSVNGIPNASVSTKQNPALGLLASPLGLCADRHISKTFSLTATIGDEDDVHSELTVDNESVISSGYGADFSIPDKLAKRYFGQPAKTAFNNQCSWLFKQLGHMSISPSKKSLPKIIFPNSANDDDDDSSIESLDQMNDKEFDNFTIPTTAECVASVMVEPSSPRSSYIYECLSTKVNPRSHLLVRDQMTTTLNLKHQGMVSAFAWSYYSYLRSLCAADVGRHDGHSSI